ncbi:CaiB/BaiF CoA transferase family protein [Sphingomonas abietis]|uniref:CoA transferase n=1 Tax=Sphingomonas abietis TaxID=3012344 RepID=A0ABY7NII0_9SPHN|nr:CoA transferase [Sphingomonas abietis]WBO21293.1 CoA transferase [Sphingomonas abietis]
MNALTPDIAAAPVPAAGQAAIQPLAGLRIVAVEQYGAGPFGTQQLADLGAEVIKIENHKDGGDVGRHVGPHFFGPEDSHFYEAFNRNKKSLGLDLKSEEGRGILEKLVASADVVFNNLRGDLPAKLGLDYATLGAVNPRIVCAHLSAYGRTGSRANWPGYDYLMQAEAGYLSLTGEPDSPPSRFGLSIIDFMTGTTAAMAILAGVVAARAQGVGRDYDVSLFDVALSNLNYVAEWYLNSGVTIGRTPRSGHPSLTPSQLYTTADGWIFIMCNKEKFWQVMAPLIGKPEWASDPRYATFQARFANRGAFNADLDAVLAKRTTAEWMALFAGKVPAAPVLDVGEALDNPFVREQGRIIDFAHPEHGALPGVASAVRAGGAAHPAKAAPTLGQDTTDILTSLGFGAHEIAALREQAIVR